MKRRGFTLIELLVVVGIIAILVAILVPALGHAKLAAQKASTTALMSQLEGSIAQYYTTFDAYPGPASLNETAGASKKLSGAQNMLLGLSYAMNPPVPLAGTPVTLNFASGTSATVYPSAAAGPINFAASNPLTGQGQQLSAFFTVTPKNVSPSVNGVWPTGGISGASNGNQFAFPVVMDTFSDALPILYYRHTAGVETPTNIAGGDTYQGGTPPNAYYYLENQEYTRTGAVLTSPSGASFTQNGTVNTSYLCGSRGIAVTSGAVHGGYILMSAGVDRLYGTGLTQDGADLPSDDMIMIGGD